MPQNMPHLFSCLKTIDLDTSFETGKFTGNDVVLSIQ